MKWKGLFRCSDLACIPFLFTCKIGFVFKIWDIPWIISLGHVYGFGWSVFTSKFKRLIIKSHLYVHKWVDSNLKKMENCRKLLGHFEGWRVFHPPECPFLSRVSPYLQLCMTIFKHANVSALHVPPSFLLYSHFYLIYISSLSAFYSQRRRSLWQTHNIPKLHVTKLPFDNAESSAENVIGRIAIAKHSSSVRQILVTRLFSSEVGI